MLKVVVVVEAEKKKVAAVGKGEDSASKHPASSGVRGQPWKLAFQSPVVVAKGRYHLQLCCFDQERAMKVQSEAKTTPKSQQNQLNA